MSIAPFMDAPLPLFPKNQEYPAQLSIAGLTNPKVFLDGAIEQELEQCKQKVQQSFWNKLKATKTGCKEYCGVKKDGRYGWMRVGSKCYYTHRIAAWLVGLVDSPRAPHNQSIRGFVLHHCDNQACCNPDHLWVGNTSDNQLDCYKKRRRISPRNRNFYSHSHEKEDFSGNQLKLL